MDVYMEEKTKPKIKAVVERELIAQHVKTIIEVSGKTPVQVLPWLSAGLLCRCLQPKALACRLAGACLYGIRSSPS